jgi:hypothetical protein
MRRSRIQHRGAILAAALVCLLIVMVFAGAVAQSMARRQRGSRWDERQSQCFWLTESAISRGMARSRLDPAYRGETWTVTPGLPGASATGVAEIRVEPIDGGEALRRIVVEARWPDDSVERVVRTRELTFDLSEQGAGP